ncbi:MAG: AraC family transcriptional regulator [Lentisphaerae bacterium]|nr:MAG: AraC family transcriptional regulator [Lentisphaerota bacterium]
MTHAKIQEIEAIHTTRILGTIGPADANAHIGMGFTCGCTIRKPRVERITDSFMLSCILNGEAVYWTRNKRYTLQPGMLVQRFHGEWFAIERNPRQHWLAFFVKLPQQLAEFWQAIRFIDPNRITLPIKIDTSLVAELKTVIPKLQCNTQAEQMEMVNLTQQMAVLLLRRAYGIEETTESEHWLAEAEVLLSRDLEQRIPIPEMARSLHIGYEKFRKVFRQYFGIAPKEYRIRKRIAEAQRLLLDENLSPAIVAERLGYPDIYSFAKQFKRVTGITPAVFRRHEL